MKKVFFMLAAALVALVSFVGCNPDPKPGDAEDSVEKTVYQFSYVLGDAGTDNLDFMDLSVTYLDANGKKQTEKVTALPWKKTIEGLKEGFKMELEKNIVLKQDVDLSKIEGESVKMSSLGVAFSISGSDKSFQSAGSSSTMTIAKEKAAEYVNRLIEKNKPFSFVHKK